MTTHADIFKQNKKDSETLQVIGGTLRNDYRRQNELTIETEFVLLERVIIIATSYGPTATDYLLVISFIHNLR